MSRVSIRVLAAAVFALSCSAPAAQDEQAVSTRSTSRVTIGPDDTVTIVALNVDEISRAWRISSSGELSLPLVGQIKAAGKTVEDMQREVASRLKEYVRDPQVMVFLSEIRSRPVTVSGAVERPGTQQLAGTTTLYAALVQAGGAKDAGPTVTLTRKLAFGRIPDPRARTTEDGAYSVIDLPLQEVTRGFGEAADLVVFPYDVVTVSQEKRTKMVYVSGDVGRPGAIELVSQDTVSLTKAIVMAGGLTHTSSPGKTMIRHIGANGIETALGFVNLKPILSGKAKDLFLSDGDIVTVPSNQLLGYLQTASTSAITAGVYVLGRL
ncbi:MAG: polysaccharide biosynthesis/export family protein [Candidatus Solibacter sp.]|jgi:polysaccharide export outer membrane protein